MLQQIALGGTMIALPIYLQMVLEYDALQAGLSIAPLSLSMIGVSLLAGRKAGDRRPSTIVRLGFALLALGLLVLLPVVPRAESGWALLAPLATAGSAGLPAQQLHAVPDLRRTGQRAAGINSASGSFGLSFGLAFAGAILLATLSIAVTNEAEGSKVLAPAEKQRVADALEDDAQVMSNTQLEELLVDQPKDVQAEISASTPTPGP